MGVEIFETRLRYTKNYPDQRDIPFSGKEILDCVLVFVQRTEDGTADCVT